MVSAVIFWTDCEPILGNDYTSSHAEIYDLSEQHQKIKPSFQLPK